MNPKKTNYHHRRNRPHISTYISPSHPPEVTHDIVAGRTLMCDVLGAIDDARYPRTRPEDETEDECEDEGPCTRRVLNCRDDVLLTRRTHNLLGELTEPHHSDTAYHYTWLHHHRLSRVWRSGSVSRLCWWVGSRLLWWVGSALWGRRVLLWRWVGASLRRWVVGALGRRVGASWRRCHLVWWWRLSFLLVVIHCSSVA